MPQPPSSATTLRSRGPSRAGVFRRSGDATEVAVIARGPNRHQHAITDRVRGIVSREKRRLKADGYDLDLSYITRRLVAMGYPATDLEAMYRNDAQDVYDFFEEHHGGRYKFYNLCSERSYPAETFHGRVARYPFDDHNPPPLSLFVPFCKDVSGWLKSHPENVAAVHCKAGKGRTGVMICAFLLYNREWSDPEGVMQFFGFARTNNQKGVTIPSQRRFIGYFATLLQQWDEQEGARNFAASQRSSSGKESDRSMGPRRRVSSRHENREEMESIRRHLLSGEEDDSDSEEEDLRLSTRISAERRDTETLSQSFVDLSQKSIDELKKVCRRYDVDFSGFLQKQEYVTAIFDTCRATQGGKGEARMEVATETLKPVLNPRAMPSRVRNLVNVFETLADEGTDTHDDDDEDGEVSDQFAEMLTEQHRPEEDVALQLQEARRTVRRRSQVLPVSRTPTRTPVSNGTGAFNFQKLPAESPRPLTPTSPMAEVPEPIFAERGFPGAPVALAITEVVLHGLPKTLLGTYEPIFTITCGDIVYRSQDLLPYRKYPQAPRTVIALPNLAVVEEVLVVFYQRSMIGAVEKLFQCWFHTFFVKDKKLWVPKAELDKACRDKHHKRYPRNFAITLHFEDLDDDAREDAQAKLLAARGGNECPGSA